MLSNWKIVIYVSLMSIIFGFVNIPIVAAEGLSGALLKDVISMFLVFLITFLLFGCAVNNINYTTFDFFSIRMRFLIDSLVITGIISFLIGVSIYLLVMQAEGGVIGGKTWRNIGSAIGVSLVTVFYSFISSVSCYFIYRFCSVHYDFSKKVLNFQKSKIWLSILNLFIAALIFSLNLFLIFAQANLSFAKITNINYLIFILLNIMLFIIILGKNSLTIWNSFLNNTQSSISLNQTLSSINHYVNIIAGLNVMYISSGLLAMAFRFTLESTTYNAIITFTFLLSINFLFILISKMIELRLRSDLIGQNQTVKPYDKYFIFKFVLPTFLAYTIILMFHFTISLFK